VAAFKFVAFSKKYDVSTLQGGNFQSFDSEMIVDMMEIVALICQKSSKKITADWLMNNLDMNVLMQFVEYIFEPLNKTTTALETQEPGEDGKN
jgi:hypothetical protein